MGFWEIFWAILILFSFGSFMYMSVKILIKGLAELKYMLSKMGTDNKKE